jgi:homoserine dehydrogenase
MRISFQRVTPPSVALLLIGYGNVARRFVHLLDELRPALAQLGIHPRIIGVATGRHGSVVDEAGLEAARIDRELLSGNSPAGSSASFISDTFARLGPAGIRVLVETTPLDVRSGEPAVAHVRAALASGAHVITANKGPAAFEYRALADEADRAGLSFLFEGAVMDGLPVFNLVRETLPAVTVSGFRGVVNSTTNYMLTAMERGDTFDAALGRMQQQGVAEADPSLDLDGWDAAAKTAALANVLLDASSTPLTVAREGIGPATGARAMAARARGRRLKLVARGSGRGPAADLRVRLEELDADDPLAILDGQANALELDTWPLGRIVITQRDGGMEKTAYALLADLATIVRRVHHQIDR